MDEDGIATKPQGHVASYPWRSMALNEARCLTFFEKFDPIRKRVIRSRHQLPTEELPKGARPVGAVEWRMIPETEQERLDATFRR